jgi:hypothetical protein
MAKGSYTTNLRTPDGGLRFEIGVDTGAWAAAWKKFPIESGKWANKFVNDQAFYFRDQVFKVISSRYKIRNEKFIRNTILIQKARPSRTMENIFAIVGTGYGNTADPGFDARGGAVDAGEKTFRFSGFSEELTGSPSTIARPHWRVTTDAGRVGRVWTGMTLPVARMRPNERIPSMRERGRAF